VLHICRACALGERFVLWQHMGGVPVLCWSELPWGGGACFWGGLGGRGGGWLCFLVAWGCVTAAAHNPAAMHQALLDVACQ
jgi:hypothetical protein